LTTSIAWEAKYGGVGSDEANRLSQLEDENRQLEEDRRNGLSPFAFSNSRRAPAGARDAARTPNEP